MTEQEYYKAELVGGEVSAVDTVNALSSPRCAQIPFAISLRPLSVCFAARSSHLCLYSKDFLWPTGGT